VFTGADADAESIRLMLDLYGDIPLHGNAEMEFRTACNGKVFKRRSPMLRGLELTIPLRTASCYPLERTTEMFTSLLFSFNPGDHQLRRR
jgi:hypothetical protein